MKRYLPLLLFVVILSSTVVSQSMSETMQLLKQPITQGSFRAFSKVNNTIFTIGYDLDVSSHCSKSTDGGSSWQTTTFPFTPGDNINGVSFATESIGYIGGDAGLILKTTDGGFSWTNKSTASYTGDINSIYFFDENIGYVVGGSVTNVNIIKTTDGGTTWSVVTTPIPSRTLYDILWVTQSEGIVVGSGSQYARTTDGGATWTAGTMPGLSTTLYRIRQADAQTFYAVGTAGRVFKSTDGGINFTLLTTPITAALYTCEFYDAQNGVALGSNGVVIRTTNGGTNWTIAPVFSTEVIRASLKIGNTILAGGYESNLGISTDAGATWRNTGSTSRDFYGIYAESPLKYTVAGDRGELHQTTDGGVTWKKSAFMMGDFLYDVYTSGDKLYTCGRLGAYFTSTDNGMSWTNRSVGSSTTRNYKMNFSDENTGYMVNNEGGILFTTNQGTNWSTQTTLTTTTLYDIKMLSSTVGYAVGSGERIFKTTNGINFAHGTMVVPAGQMTGVAMVNENTGFICGENGAFYKTTDGFQTVTLLTDTVALQGKVVHDIVIFSEDNVWAVGRGGLLIHRTGGVTSYDTTNVGIDYLGAAKISNFEFVVAASDGRVYKVSDQTVPVELVSFTAQTVGNEVVLNWTTATETNNKGFEIQKRTDGSWQEVAFISGNGTVTSPVNYSFTDRMVTGKNYSNEVEVAPGVNSFALMQNYPNPFNPSTLINYSIPEAGQVSLRVYDITGMEVATLVNEIQSPGAYSINFDASTLTTGVYFYKLETGRYSMVKKLSLIK
ncbi:MAG: T9SS type A sorting domain-containing protein [Ignavibacteriales bacterium]|nr:T9SS type A sorting domain-containing protein [Ignavibacteriales bacterium]